MLGWRGRFLVKVGVRFRSGLGLVVTVRGYVRTRMTTTLQYSSVPLGVGLGG